MFHFEFCHVHQKLEIISNPCFLITVPEGSEMDYEEEPEYTLESLFSDIGGAAGLALGMSLATFFGALEYLLYRLLCAIYAYLRQFTNRLVNITVTLAKRQFDAINQCSLVSYIRGRVIITETQM
jgi:hypothetical protein